MTGQDTLCRPADEGQDLLENILVERCQITEER